MNDNLPAGADMCSVACGIKYCVDIEHLNNASCEDMQEALREVLNKKLGIGNYTGLTFEYKQYKKKTV